jgi:hypothetical protein
MSTAGEDPAYHFAEVSKVIIYIKTVTSGGKWGRPAVVPEQRSRT